MLPASEEASFINASTLAVDGGSAPVLSSPVVVRLNAIELRKFTGQDFNREWHLHGNLQRVNPNVHSIVERKYCDSLNSAEVGSIFKFVILAFFRQRKS